MNRSESMARFDESDDSRPEFVCASCGYAFNLPRQAEEVHACECGRDLCDDCTECEPCRKQAELDEELRQIAETAMRADLDYRNKLVARFLEIIP